VRALRDEEGRVLLLYGFSDKETLIIVRNEASYTALVERLAASRGQ
jgi:tRNA(His) 5'-end guanylyltransferase